MVHCHCPGLTSLQTLNLSRPEHLRRLSLLSDWQQSKSSAASPVFIDQLLREYALSQNQRKIVSESFEGTSPGNVLGPCEFCNGRKALDNLCPELLNTQMPVHLQGCRIPGTQSRSPVHLFSKPVGSSLIFGEPGGSFSSHCRSFRYTK
jgi:hypothetical protein